MEKIFWRFLFFFTCENQPPRDKFLPMPTSFLHLFACRCSIVSMLLHLSMPVRFRRWSKSDCQDDATLGLCRQDDRQNSARSAFFVCLLRAPSAPLRRSEFLEQSQHSRHLARRQAMADGSWGQAAPGVLSVIAALALFSRVRPSGTGMQRHLSETDGRAG